MLLLYLMTPAVVFESITEKEHVIGIVFVDFVTMALLVVVIGDAVDMLAFAIAFLDKMSITVIETHAHHRSLAFPSAWSRLVYCLGDLAHLAGEVIHWLLSIQMTMQKYYFFYCCVKKIFKRIKKGTQPYGRVPKLKHIRNDSFLT